MMLPGPKSAVRLSFALIVSWQILLIYQGLDLADTGFHLTAFRFIMEDPYAVQYSMSFWLSDIVGYLWMSVWPEGGLIWARLGAVLVLSLAVLVYFSFLKKEIGAREAAIGLLVVCIIAVKGGFECLNYDILSILGFSLTIAFLYRGLKSDRKWMLFVSGLFMGVTIFFKLTNIAGILLFLLIPFSVFLKKEKVIHLGKLSLAVILGVLVGAGAILLLIRTLGHWDLFFDNFAFISSMANDGTASHGFISILTSYIRGYGYALILLLIFLIAVWFFIKISNIYQLKISGKLSILAIVASILVSVIFMILFEAAFWSKIRYLLIGLMLLVGIQYALDRSRSYQNRLLSMAGVLLLVISPLGSDSGLSKSVFGMWILGPLLLTQLDLNSIFTPIALAAKTGHSALIRKIVLAVVLSGAILFAWQHTYFDTGSRWEKRYPLEHPQLKGIYTTKERAAVVNEVTEQVFPLMKGGYLLSFIEIPMMNYLFDTKPFLSTSWPKLYYNPESFEKKLDEAVETRKALPVIIRQKQNSKVYPWPEKKADPEYLNYPDGLSEWPEHGRILNQFIENYNYAISWENEMFQVLISTEEPERD